MNQFQWAALDRRRAALAQKGLPFSEANRTLLVPRFVDFEVAKAAAAGTTLNRNDLQPIVEALLSLTKPVSLLNSGDLARMRGTGIAFRETPLSPRAPHHQPVHPEMIPRALDRFFEWVQSRSFADMHAIEQMSIAQMRLLEIHPFETLGEFTAALFSCYFPMAAGHLAPTPSLSQITEFNQALDSAWAYSTSALVEFNLRAVQNSYEAVESLAI